MGYVVLWIEQLIFCWLLIAAGLAWVAGPTGRGGRLVWKLAIVLVPVLFWGAVAVTLRVLELGVDSRPVHLGLTWPICGLTLGILLGGIVIFFSAERNRRRAALVDLLDEPRPIGSASWLFACALVMLGGHILTLWNLDVAAQQQLAMYRTEASSLALANSPPRVVDRENAALLYQSVIDAGLSKITIEEDWLDKKGHPVEGLFENEKFLERMRTAAPLLKIVRQAAARPVCHFGRDWGRPSISMLLPELQELRTMARLLVLEARYKASREDRKGALENALATHRLAEHVGQEPILISLLVSFAIDQVGKDCLEYLLRTHPFGSEEFAVLDDWQINPVGPRLLRGYRLEEAFGTNAFCQIAEDIDIAGQLEIGHSGMTGLGYRLFVLGGDLQSYRQLMSHWQSAAHQNFSARTKAAQEFEAKLKAGRCGPLTSMLFPALQKVHESAARADATQRITYLALAMHRHRLRTGNFPEKLDELLENAETYIPVDPFDGEPIRLRIVGEERILYSIGQDLHDDEGVPLGELSGNDSMKGDIAFRLKVPGEAP